MAICEILDALEYNYVVGVPESAKLLPKRYEDVKTIGAPMSPDLEIIKSISPELVLTPETLKGSLGEQYQSAGIKAEFLDLSSVEGMHSAIGILGQLLSCQEEADRLIADYQNYMAVYHEKNSEDGPSVLLLMAFPDGFYLVSTEKSYVGNLVKLAGGVNVYGDSVQGGGVGFINVNPEDIVQKEPDLILVFAHYSEEDAFQFMGSELERNAVWKNVDAAVNGKILYLPSEYFGMSATLNWKEGLSYLEPFFYEDAE